MKEIIHRAIIQTLIDIAELDDGLEEWVFCRVHDDFAYHANALDVVHEIHSQTEELIKILKKELDK